MLVRCKDVLSLPSFKTSTVVAGASGLERVISWLYIAECLNNPLQAIDWIDGGELVYITGVGLKRNEKLLIDFISKINEKNAAGLIINIGETFHEIPKKAIEIANELSLPLIEIPWDVKLINISQDVCNAIITKKIDKESLDNLLESILFSDFESEEDFIMKAKHYEYMHTDIHRIGIIDFDNLAKYVKDKNINDEKDIIGIKNELQNIVYETFLKNNQKIITMQKNDRVIFMLKANNLKTESITSIINKIENIIIKKYNTLNLKVGIGNTYPTIKNMRKSFDEAERALQIVKCENSIYTTLFYEHFNIYNLLLNIEDKSLLHGFTNNILGPLLEYDRINNSDLLNNLESYLKENCNIVSASNKLFIHKNTLKYRIQKIEKILNCNLSNINDCVQLDIAFKINKLLQVKR